MRIANLKGRAVAVVDDRAVDLHTASDGRFGPDPADVFERWDEFVGWAPTASFDGGESFDVADLGAPSPAPRQIFAIGLNYAEHAAESGHDRPTGLPPVFPKFLSALSGPVTTVTLPEGGHTDWEVELVVVIGRECTRIAEADAWDAIAGVTVGNDLSERVRQLAGPAPQFGLGKSHPGFAPTGPWLVTPDEFDDRDDLALSCSLDGEVVQESRTRHLIASVPQLVAGLTEVVTLYPGDLIFTGTPEGVGNGRTPPRWIQDGQTLVSRIEGIGELRQTFVAAR